jgi:hypothetical protein
MYNMQVLLSIVHAERGMATATALKMSSAHDLHTKVTRGPLGVSSHARLEAFVIQTKLN